MADRVIRAILTADVRGVDKAFGQVAASGRKLEASTKGASSGLTRLQTVAKGTGGVVGRLGDAARSGVGMLGRLGGATKSGIGALNGLTRMSDGAQASLSDLSSTGLRVGAGLGVGLGLAAKAAIDWESAWAGVTKTVDGSDSQMAQLEGQLRGLAKTLPATHEEIAGVAEAAGQLGVARADIVEFTETAIRMGESTNLSAEEAATGMQKIANVMSVPTSDIDNMGSAIVALGNAGASTESDIVAMTQRLTGTGKIVGATTPDLLALANAMSSVGIESELGGGAMSRTMLEIESAVKSGSSSLADFAEVSGVSVEEFSRQWAENPVRAVQMFTDGLARVSAQGGDVSGVLTDVGLAGTQNAQVLLRLAGASDVLTDSLQLGQSAWVANTALMTESEKRFATTASQIKIARNNVKDAAIDFGSVLGPGLVSVSKGVSSAASGLASLPGPAKQAAVEIAGVASAALLVGGAGGKAIGGFINLRQNMATLSAESPKAAAGLGKVAKAAKVAGAALVAIEAIRITSDALGLDDLANRLAPEQLTRNLRQGQDAVAAFNAEIDRTSQVSTSLGSIETGVASFDDVISAAFNPSKTQNVENFFNGLGGVVGIDNVSQIAVAEQRLSELDDALTGLVSSGQGDQAKQMFDQFAAAAQRQGVSVEQLATKLPQYREALAQIANQQQQTGTSGEKGAAGIDQVGDAAAASEAAVDDLTNALKGLGSALLGQRGSARDYEASLDDATAALKENGRTLDTHTEKGRANGAALDQIASATTEWATSTFEATGDIDEATAILDRGKSKYIDVATAMGMPKRAARELADELFTLPADVVTNFKSTGAEKVKGDAKDVTNWVNGVPPEKPVILRSEGARSTVADILTVKGSVDQVPESKTTKIGQAGAEQATSRVVTLMDTIYDLEGKEVPISERGALASAGRVGGLHTKIVNLDGKTVSVQEVGSTASGERVVILNGKIVALKGKTVSVGAEVFGGNQVGALAGSIASLQSRVITVTTRFVQQGNPAGAANASRIMWGNAHGAVYEHATTGITTRALAAGDVLQRRPSGAALLPTTKAGLLWVAEDTRDPWEAYIPGGRSKRRRSRALTEDVVARLGGSVQWVTPYAQGTVRETRTYTPSRALARPAAQPVSASVDSGLIAGAVSRAVGEAMGSYRPVWRIGNRAFYGAMVSASRDYKDSVGAL